MREDLKQQQQIQQNKVWQQKGLLQLSERFFPYLFHVYEKTRFHMSSIQKKTHHQQKYPYSNRVNAQANMIV